jgi:hypothetical protein
MLRVTYFVRMTAKEGEAEEVEELLLTPLLFGPLALPLRLLP